MHRIIHDLECIFWFFRNFKPFKSYNNEKVAHKEFAIGRHFDIYERDPAHSLDVLSGFSTIPI